VTNADLVALLAVLRAGGVTSATFHPDGTLRNVTLGSAAPQAAAETMPAVFADDANELPPGAYDVVARAKLEGK
jgi:hypothetical protein